MSNGSARRKGKGGELEACQLLAPFFPSVARELNQPQGSPLAGRDLRGTEPFCIQVKRGKTRPAIETALEEALGAVTERYDVPTVLVRGDRGRWLAVMYASDWITMAARAE